MISYNRDSGCNGIQSAHTLDAWPTSITSQMKDEGKFWFHKLQKHGQVLSLQHTAFAWRICSKASTLGSPFCCVMVLLFL